MTSYFFRMLNYYWRTLVTSGCFIAFAVLGILFSLLLYPLLRLLDAERRHTSARWLLHKFFWLIVAVLRSTGCMRLQTAGIKRLQDAGAVLVLANHPTYIDFVVLLSLTPNANCVVKSEHWDNPVFGGMLRAAEGTRSSPGAPMKFLRGAGYIALKSGRPIVPVLLRCDPPTLNKNSRWYQVPPRPFHYRVTVRNPLRADTLADTRQGSPVIAARRLTDALEGYFSNELSVL